jgi:hypothetical protein
MSVVLFVRCCGAFVAKCVFVRFFVFCWLFAHVWVLEAQADRPFPWQSFLADLPEALGENIWS